MTSPGVPLAYFMETYQLPIAHSKGWPFWTVGGPERSDRYGCISLSRTEFIEAHVLACTLAHGSRPDGMEAAHSCPENRLCYWSEHLSWKTHKDNMQDAILHGTIGGEQHGSAKLTVLDVLTIRSLYAAGCANQPQLAECYGVSKVAIHKIIARKTWQKV